MQRNFLVIATMGSSGQKWLEEMLKRIPGINVAHWIPGLPADYKKTIEHNPMLRRVDMQNHTLRTVMPLECLFEEVQRVCPPTPLYVVSHFHTALSLWNNYQKYPNPPTHKVAYLYGCPIKRFRSAMKNNLHYTTQSAIDVEALARSVEHTPRLNVLIKDTEKHFNIILTQEQRIFIALQIFRSIETAEDIQRAEILNARMLNFEALKTEPVLMQALLAWATEDGFIHDLELLIKLYSKSADLAKYNYVGYVYADQNQDALIAAPYAGEAIWAAMSEWQRYFFRQAVALLPFDYIDFYDELGIDVSYMRAK